MTLNEVMQELHSLSDPQTKKTLMRHGAKEPFYGVKVGEMKKILKKTKKNHELSLQLYATGNSDAMYLAGLMADEQKITKEQLDEWVKAAYWSYLSEFAVPWVASETPYGIELGLKWIDSKEETIASAGWQTLSSCATVMKDEELDEQLIGAVTVEVDGTACKVPLAVDYIEKNIATGRIGYKKKTARC
jgi:3-methyladenine DNA glycosylase AlkD